MSPAATGELTLAERIAEAEQAEEAPRQEAMSLSALHTAAVAAGNYAEAARLQPLLNTARERLVIAEGTTRGLRDGQAVADAARAEEQRAIQQAHARDEARGIIEDAMAAERQAMAAIEESLAQLWATISAARDCYRQALALETKVWQERERAYRAHVTLGERPAGMRIVKPNHATVVADRDPLVRELSEWKGPELRTPPPVFAAGAAGSCGTVQQAPW